jgi:hypothetical protein
MRKSVQGERQDIDSALPSALFEERFSSLGASWVFSFQPVLPPDYRPRFHLGIEVKIVASAVDLF